MNQSEKAERIERLVRSWKSADPGIRVFHRVAKGCALPDVDCFVQVTSRTPTSENGVEFRGFPPAPDFPYGVRVAQVTPFEWGEITGGKMSMPDWWHMDQVTEILPVRGTYSEEVEAWTCISGCLSQKEQQTKEICAGKVKKLIGLCRRSQEKIVEQAAEIDSLTSDIEEAVSVLLGSPDGYGDPSSLVSLCEAAVSDRIAAEIIVEEVNDALEGKDPEDFNKTVIAHAVAVLVAREKQAIKLYRETLLRAVKAEQAEKEVS